MNIDPLSIPLAIHKTCDVTQDKKLSQEEHVKLWKTELLTAIEQGELFLVKTLFRSPDILRIAREKNFDALVKAAEHGHLEMLKFLLCDSEIEKDLVTTSLSNPKSGKWCPPLQYAVQAGHLNVVDFLLQIPSVLKIVDENYLFSATRNGHLKIINRLLEIPEILADAHLALSAAAEGGNLLIINRLLEIVEPKLTAASQYEALYNAAINGHLPVVNRLLHLKGILDTITQLATARNKNLLHGAIANMSICYRTINIPGKIEVVNRLLEIPHLLENATQEDNRALISALRVNQPAIAHRLLDIPAVFELATKDSGLVYQAFDAGFIDIVDRLLTASHLAQEFTELYTQALMHLSSCGGNLKKMEMDYIGNRFNQCSLLDIGMTFNSKSCRTGILIHLALKNENSHLACALFELFHGENAKFLSEKADIKYKETNIPLTNFLVSIVNDTIKIPSDPGRTLVYEKPSGLSQTSVELQKNYQPTTQILPRQKPFHLFDLFTVLTNHIITYLDTADSLLLSLSSKRFNKDVFLKNKLRNRLQAANLLRHVFFADPKSVENFFTHDLTLADQDTSVVLERTEAAEYLHSNSPIRKINLIWDNISPLEAAAWRGDNLIVKMLLRYIPKKHLALAMEQLKQILARNETAENGGYLAPYHTFHRIYTKYQEEFPAACAEKNTDKMYQLALDVWNANRTLPKNGLQAFYDSINTHGFKDEPNRSHLDSAPIDWDCSQCGLAIYYENTIWPQNLNCGVHEVAQVSTFAPGFALNKRIRRPHPNTMTEFCQAKTAALQEIILSIAQIMSGGIPESLEPSIMTTNSPSQTPIIAFAYVWPTNVWPTKQYTLAPLKTVPQALYEFGRVLLCQGDEERNPDKQSQAVKYLRDAAFRGYVKAQAVYGALLQEGALVDRNTKEAQKWLTNAAEAGDLEAHCDLGIMFESGDGVPKDKKAAAEWYGKAALQGNEEAMNWLFKKMVQPADHCIINSVIEVLSKKGCIDILSDKVHSSEFQINEQNKESVEAQVKEPVGKNVQPQFKEQAKHQVEVHQDDADEDEENPKRRKRSLRSYKFS